MATIKTYSSFINESKNNTKRIWHNTFAYKGSTYRLQSWMYIYRFLDGDNVFVTVNMEDANGVSGYGVSGVVVELDKIKWLDKTTSFNDEYIKSNEEALKIRIENDKERFEFLKSLPKGLTKEQYDDAHMDYIMKKMGI